ncbi:DNA mismatch repair endonuclease MutL [Apilactobacillus micheneri]|uniref:DNA mismatch repair endonuclease MutL n=1 Tax=Apilactobacillus micheneri TaxID=1899430 RepID=UPI000D5194C2|nr:DNA mismatch repair endonuclease MutL [Apilactobacillus micheneri]GAY79392.1 DNA mismatch repair protein MutL [Apilactobacillus micheneri]
MSKIHELTPVLADQIAAGEVVERPASVIKELVENSIDAKSTQIDINVKDAGLNSMQVVDDGIGIENDDIKLAFKRHATSKINNPQDLFKVHSLGFRGEALPSIASVSDVQLKTSTGDEGTKLHIRGSKIESIMPSESRRGTSITVSDLFYNTPARLKYMKSLQTELAKITDIVDRLAIGHPNIAFSLVHNNRELIRTSGRNNLQQVIGDIYGARNLKRIIKINNQDDDFKINGYISLPELTRASRNYVTIILNGRYVKNYNIFKALTDGYGSKLMVGRYPIVTLNINLDPTLIDVNVHPTKQTVRISKEEQLCNLISKTVYDAIFPQNLIPDAMNRDQSVKPHYETSQIQMDLNKASTHHPISSLENFKDNNKSYDLDDTIDESVKSDVEASNVENSIIIKNKSDLSSSSVINFKEKYDNESDALPFGETKSELNSDESNLDDVEVTRFPNLRYIGQLHGTYLIAESDNGMYILDQHAAQERINYEKFRTEIGDVSDDQQNLLVPIVLDYPASDAIIIKQKIDVLHSVGINIEIFGKNSFVVKQHPTWIKGSDEEETIRSMIDWVIENKKISVASFRAKTAIMMSCKRAIKANHHLDRKQAINLIDNLSKVQNPFNCPHGRPVLVSFSNADMERMFKRIQDPHKSE